MKVLVAHNYYQYQGGEDSVFSNETLLLRRHGNEVIEFVRHNGDIPKFGLRDYATLPIRTLWNWDSYADIKQLLLRHKPDVAHFHNTFPLISPAAYDACWDCNVPVIQSLHNSRLFCPSSGLYYQGRYCEDCLGKTLPWPGIYRGCYRGSRLQTGLVGIMTSVHHGLRTWTDKVSRYIVFNSFFRQKFIQAGFPADKLAIKPHFLDDPGRKDQTGGYALYVGRFTQQKGIRTLLRAWERLGHIPLKLCGAGPLDDMVQKQASKSGGLIEVIPFAPRETVYDLMKGAAFLIWPSEAVESFGLVALEAFACSIPVIFSGLDPMAELVAEDHTGIAFRAGDPEDLARKCAWAWDHKEKMSRMGLAARAEYERKHSAASNYSRLVEIYQEAIEHRRQVAAFTQGSLQRLPLLD
jgi:glycosyltransferase involved in cell wall biosynthesis